MPTRVTSRPPDAVIDQLHHDYAADGYAAQRAKLVECYLPFAYRIASRYRDRGERLEDLRQVALTALLVAIDRFDPERGVKFTTYGGRCIAGELKRHFRDAGWAVRVGRSAQERYLELRATVEALDQELGRNPTIPEVAARMRIPDDDVLMAMEIGDVRQATSLDAPVHGRDGDRAVDVGGADPGFDAVEAEVLNEQVLARLLGRLSESDRRLVELYYLEGRTQMEVAQLVGASQVSVSRHLSRILTRLRAIVAEDVVAVA